MLFKRIAAVIVWLLVTLTSAFGFLASELKTAPSDFFCETLEFVSENEPRARNLNWENGWLHYDTASGYLVATKPQFSKEKQALVDMAKKDKKTGMTKGDMQAYKDLNKELRDPFPSNKVRGPEAHPNRGPHAQKPHGHVGPVNHIPIK